MSCWNRRQQRQVEKPLFIPPLEVVGAERQNKCSSVMTSEVCSSFGNMVKKEAQNFLLAPGFQCFSVTSAFVYCDMSPPTSYCSPRPARPLCPSLHGVEKMAEIRNWRRRRSSSCGDSRTML